MLLANQIKIINHQIFLSFTYAEFTGSRVLIKASKFDIIIVHENLNPTLKGSPQQTQPSL